jgi:DNA polymerase-3 subunit delta
MIVALAGENSFSLQQKLQPLVQSFLDEHGDLALERIDAEEAEISRIKESLTTLPFLSSKKLIVLRSPSKNKQFVEQFEQILGDISETTDVIIVESKLDKRLAYYKYLKSKTDFHDFGELDANALTHYLVNSAKEQGGVINMSDARYLVERVGANQQRLASELAKLLTYNSHVTVKTIELLTEAAPQSTIFELLEAAFAGNTRKALKLYSEQRALKVEAPQIIAMLAWQLHVLVVIKTAAERSADEIARDARINPFVVRKSQAIARKISLAELKKLIKDLLDIDLKSKRTRLDIDDALQHYLLKLSH